jgi:hypothetical protein
MLGEKQPFEDCRVGTVRSISAAAASAFSTTSTIVSNKGILQYRASTIKTV